MSKCPFYFLSLRFHYVMMPPISISQPHLSYSPLLLLHVSESTAVAKNTLCSSPHSPHTLAPHSHMPATNICVWLPSTFYASRETCSYTCYPRRSVTSQRGCHSADSSAAETSQNLSPFIYYTHN